MEHLQYELTDGIAVLTLKRGKANAIHLPMITEMAAAFERATEEAAAIVWSSGCPRFFSAGFDVNEVFTYDRAQLTEFLGTFSRLQQSILHCPKPVVAALPGQTYAGGAILALSCDFRVMADGPYGFALTEVNIGVNLPPSIFHLLASAVGVPKARQMFLTGEPIFASQAFAMGLVHELADESEVTDKAIAWAKKLAAKPAGTYAAIKRTMLDSIHLSRTDELVVDVDAWFTPEAAEFKKRLREKLAK
ncbi:MAG: enoyl-CoA hydratase/isomerase family protein [Acidobacteria bacterium]|nr:enoyl-CoA hydratase/isomerase family protein [Acidobacteriota bacterium]